MTQTPMAILGAALAAAVSSGVAGLAAQPVEDRSRDRAVIEQPPDAGPQRRTGRDVFITPGTPSDRRVIRLDGRGSQIGVMVSDVEGTAPAGVRIDGVDDDSPAAKAGVKDGDVVLEFDGERVRSARQLTRLVQESPAGRAVPLIVRRGSDRQTLAITPESADATWNMSMTEPGLRGEIERGLRTMPDLPELREPMFNFRFDRGLPVVGRGRLGVQVEPLSDQLAAYFGATAGGVLVSSVTKDSPAEKAGVKAGDVITAVNGAAVRDADDLVAQISEAADGSQVNLGVVRDKKTTTLTATITPPQPARATRGSRPA